MNGPIAQVVALALHGNAVLAGGHSGGFVEKNSTAQFCQYVAFVREESTWFGLGQPARTELRAPEDWFEDLRRRRAVRIGVRWVAGRDQGFSDRMLAAFVGGGGTWTLQVQLADGTYEQWVAQWEVDESRRQQDRKIWKVTYTRAHAGKLHSEVAGFDEARAELGRALAEIHAFASRTDARPFTESFAKALSALNGEPGSEAYHRDLFPAGRGSGTASAILQAAQHAWVFGGMGSWNDLGFKGADDKEYERVSEQLFQALTRAIPAAVEGADAA